MFYFLQIAAKENNMLLNFKAWWKSAFLLQEIY